MKQAEQIAEALERLSKEYEEIEALREAANVLRALRVRQVDVRFD